MFFLKKLSNSKALRPRNRYEFIFLAVFLFFAFMPRPASAQGIITFDPVTAGIQSIIQHLTAANTAIEAAESKIQTELSALTYARQGEQLMNQIQELQQESSTLLTSVNNIEGTVMMPAGELQGLKNSLTEEQTNMQNIIAQEKALGNPQMSQFLQNYANTYGDYGTANETPVQAAQGAYNQYNTANTQAAQTAGYAQSVLNNSQNNQHLISQLGANVAAAHGQVAAEQANGQALVALTEEVNQLNKLEAQQAKLKAMQAGAKDSQQAAVAGNRANEKVFTVPTPPSVQSGFGQYPNVTNFK